MSPKKTNNKVAAERAVATAVVASPSSSSIQDSIFWWSWLGAAVYATFIVLRSAYAIRLGAIIEYGPVIHEFDPYFNYRATEYLYWNGMERFFKWFDHTVWYPLGRPVGTTIYPGMQVTAVWIKNYILKDAWSLNDICVYIPAWFGVIATFVTGAIAYEASIPVNSSGTVFQFLVDWFKGEKTRPPASTTQTWTPASPSIECAVWAMAMMSILPAHLMRSMGGGYDNESVAMTAMVSTFYFWVRSLRSNDPNSHWFGILTALAYFYMVASWGGYVFVLNMIGVHAAALAVGGRFDNKVYIAYSLFYGIGTILAMRVPVVGWMPLKSLEQLGPCAVFCAYQVLAVADRIAATRNYSPTARNVFRIKLLVAAAAVAFVFMAVAAPHGYFGPISARVRGLFVKHTKTGNPLVDSVAEHQKASSRAYFQYLHHVCVFAPIGYLYVLTVGLSDASSFLIVWGTAAYFFSHKMVRLILLTAPIGASLGGIAAGRLFTWCVRQWWEDPLVDKKATHSDGEGNKLVKKRKIKKGGASYSSSSSFDGLTTLQNTLKSNLQSPQGVLAMRSVALVVLAIGFLFATSFINYCWLLSGDLSNPSIIARARTRDGQIVKVDDYREAYWWLRDNTPEDARIMAWWDYGYQISAIGNRTTLADGNTWNHEHIALLGKTLTTELNEGWSIARHLADYVLVWAGGGGDDLAKSPHLARIANSVYRDHCPDDPTCRAFGFIDREGTPSAMMKRSLLYRLHSHKLRPGVEAPEDKFEEVFRSKYGKVRIFKLLGVAEESKEWVKENYVCDVSGSWFCPGQYPPGLGSILAKKKDFSQLEDFNKRGDGDDDYTKKYFEDLNDPEKAKQKILEKEKRNKLADKATETTHKDEDESDYVKRTKKIYSNWADTEDTTRMWQLISSNNVAELKEWLDLEPHKAYIRSKDGRGPMFWAFEQRNEEVTKLLMKAGVPHTDRDSQGMTPVDLLEGDTKNV